MEPRILTIEEAITELNILADILDEQQAPLQSVQHPGIVLDPRQTARLVRVFYQTHGAA
jgi:hypothetical protein